MKNDSGFGFGFGFGLFGERNCMVIYITYIFHSPINIPITNSE